MSERRLLCELEGCLGEVTHAEVWNNARGHRLWCEAHTPWSGHHECCGEMCKELLWKLRGNATEDEQYAAIGREVYRLWHRAMVESHSTSRLGSDVDKLMCWGPEAEREARRREREDSEIRKCWAE